MVVGGNGKEEEFILFKDTVEGRISILFKNTIEGRISILFKDTIEGRISGGRGVYSYSIEEFCVRG